MAEDLHRRDDSLEIARDERVMQHAYALLMEVRSELGRADQKADSLLMALSIVISALLAGVAAGGWTPAQLDNRVEWLWWFGAVAIIASMAAAVAAVWPRIVRTSTRKGVSYFGDIARYGEEELEQLHGDLRRAAETTIDRTVAQLRLLSCIAVRKYMLVRFALRAGASGALALVLPLVASSLLANP
jgi:hypothetical protein